MKHFMKLQQSPFDHIKAGTKKVEMRLYDNKRKLMKIGDEIEFTNILTGEKLEVKIKDLKVFSSFEKLYENFDKILLGYEKTENADPKDMQAYYPEEEILKFGVVAIIIE